MRWAGDGSVDLSFVAEKKDSLRPGSREIMLEELESRNYAPSTIRAYLLTVEHFARYLRCTPDRLGTEHIGQSQAAMFRDMEAVAAERRDAEVGSAALPLDPGAEAGLQRSFVAGVDLWKPRACSELVTQTHTRRAGRTPLSLLKTDTGSRIVEELLIQIDEGIFDQTWKWAGTYRTTEENIGNPHYQIREALAVLLGELAVVRAY